MKPPLLVYSKLSGEVYIVTRYKPRGEGAICAERKFDVTEQFDSIINKRLGYVRREKRGPIPIKQPIEGWQKPVDKAKQMAETIIVILSAL